MRIFLPTSVKIKPVKRDERHLFRERVNAVNWMRANGIKPLMDETPPRWSKQLTYNPNGNPF